MTSSETTPIAGSCLCQRITYTAHLAPTTSTPLTANRCNCAFCRKRGITTYRLPSPSHFTLLTPSSPADVADYPSPKGAGHRYFCPTCGVHVWMTASYEIQGQKVDLFAINLATIEQPQEGVELSEVEIKYVDGLHDRFMSFGEKPWKGGLV